MKRLLSVTFLAAVTPLAPAQSATASHGCGSSYASVKQPQVIVLQTPRRGVLQNRSPYTTSVRGYTKDRVATPYDATSGLPHGATREAAHELIVVRPHEAVPSIAINPWEPITDRTIDELEHNFPWLRRTESIRNDLVLARNQYLREQGYTSTVRSFKNQSRTNADHVRSNHSPMVYSADPGTDASEHTPSNPQLIIIESDQDTTEHLVEQRLKPESVIRRHESSAK